jgi:hypothetical protein
LAHSKQHSVTNIRDWTTVQVCKPGNTKRTGIKKDIKLSGPIKITVKKSNKHAFEAYRKPDKIVTRIIENKSLSQKSKGKPGGKVRGTEGRRFRKTKDRELKKITRENGR